MNANLTCSYRCMLPSFSQSGLVCFSASVECKRTVWTEGAEYCIFHEADKEATHVRELFRNAITEQFGDDDFYCVGYVFPSLQTVEIAGEMRGGLRLGDLLGDACRTLRRADFRFAEFPDNTSLRGLDFGKCTNFCGTTFGDWSTFFEANFGEDSTFVGARFGDAPDFYGATFGEGSLFVDAQFGPRGDFRYTTFGSGADLRGAKFAAGGDFRHATFNDTTDLRSARLVVGRFAHCDLGRSLIDGRTRWTAAGGVLGDELVARKGECAPEQTRREAYADAEDAYRKVRQVLKANGLYDDAGAFYYRERVCRRKSLTVSPRLLDPAVVVSGLLSAVTPCVRALRHRVRVLHWRPLPLARVSLRRAERWCEQQVELRRVPESPREQSIMGRLGEWLADFSCGYGEKPGRLIGWAVVFVVGFALLYWVPCRDYITQLTRDGPQAIRSFGSALYFSIATFTTLGFGDYAPRGSDPVKLLVAGEAVLGALTIGLAMVTFARKAIRD